MRRARSLRELYELLREPVLFAIGVILVAYALLVDKLMHPDVFWAGCAALGLTGYISSKSEKGTAQDRRDPGA